MNRRLGLVIDQERCIGCEACTVACKIENKTTDYWIRVKTQNSSRKDVPEGHFPHLRMDFLPVLCNHCRRPLCADACPSGAIVKRDDGPVLIDEKRCDGCRACIDACPYGSIVFDHEKGKAGKCTLCVHRTDVGLEPFCVVCCEGQAIFFGDLNDPESDVSRKIQRGKAFVLRPEAGTDPSVFYCPPRPPRKL